MKKIFASFLTFSLIALTFSSCSDDNDSPTGGGNGGNGGGDYSVKEYFDYPNSKNTPEEDKKNLAKAGNEFVTSLNGLEKSQIKIILDAFDALPEPPIFDENEDEGDKTEGEKDILRIFYVKDFYGKYTWNATKQEWEHSDSEENLTLLFPSEGSKTNDCKIEITGKGSGFNSDNDYELPSTVKAILSKDGKEAGTIDASATEWHKNSKGDIRAKSADVKVTTDVDYAATMSAQKSTKDELNKATLELTNGKTTLLKGFGDFEDDSKYELGKGYVDIRILDDYAIGAEGEFLKMSDKLDELEAAYNSAEYSKEAQNKYIADRVKIQNEYGKYVLVSNKEKAKIADAKYVVVTDEEGYAEESLIFVFPDKTEATVASYFGTGFDSVVSEWEKFISKF